LKENSKGGNETDLRETSEVDFKGKFETNFKRNQDVFSDAFNGEHESEFKGIEEFSKGVWGRLIWKMR
jgi:hypothetical protein